MDKLTFDCALVRQTPSPPEITDNRLIIQAVIFLSGEIPIPTPILEPEALPFRSCLRGSVADGEI